MKNDFGAKYIMVALALTALLVAGFTGCSKDSSTENTGGSQGDVKIYLVDDPSDYDAVNIVVTEVSVHVASNDSMSGWMVINDSTRTINLLNLTNGNMDILGVGRLDVGRYSQIRLKIGTGSNVVVSGQVYPLDIPSGAQTGLKLNHQFDIEANSLYEMTLDFDVSRSIHVTGNGQYMMRPVIRVVANVVSGSLSGIVSPPTTFGLVSAIVGLDTVSTYANFINGGFMLVALPSGIYSVTIYSGSDAYIDSTITGITVAARQNTNIGTIYLRHR
jgi:hypothetical protein